MILRRTILSLVLVGASIWCTGLVRQAHREQQLGIDRPNDSTPVAAPNTIETPDRPPDRLDKQLAQTHHSCHMTVRPAG